MSASDVSPAWDFTSVIDLLHSFTPDSKAADLESTGVSINNVYCDNQPVSQPSGKQTSNPTTPKLGDFGNLWELLQEPLMPNIQQPDARVRTPSPSNSNNSGVPSLSDDGFKSSLEDPTKSNTFAPKKILVREKVKEVQENTKSNISGHIDYAPRVLSSPPLGSSTTVKHDGVTNKQTTRKHSPSKAKHQIEPVLLFTAAERKANLLAKLRAQFPSERKGLASPKLSDPLFSSKNKKSNGIHVFVDMSNVSDKSEVFIMISTVDKATTNLTMIDHGWLSRLHKGSSKHTTYDSRPPRSTFFS